MSLKFPTTTLKKPSGLTAIPSGLKRPAFGTLYGFDAQGESFVNGSSISLDGSNDYLATSFDPSSVGTSDYSISLWFNINSGSTEDHPYFFAFGAGSSVHTNTYQGLGLTQRSGDGYKVRVNNYFSSYSQSASSSTSDVVAGNWYNLVLVRDGNLLTVYKNGTSLITLTNTEVGSNDFNQGSEFRIGYGYGAAGRYINGLIDEFSIFNTALTATDATSIYNSGVPTSLTSLSPVSWWRMGDGTEAGSGTTVYDMRPIGTPNNGTLTNGPTYSTDVPS